MALLVATSVCEGQPSATLGFRGGTVLSHLAGQLASLGVRRAWAITRQGHAPALRSAGADLVEEVVECGSVADDLRAVARLARTTAEPLVVLPGDLVAHRGALAGLLADPPRTGALVTAAGLPYGYAVRVEHGRVVSAGSPYHRVGLPNAASPGVLYVSPADREALADAAEELAVLAEKNCIEAVSALLLVGLVRSAVDVAARDVRLLCCLRAGDRAGAQAADAALREVDEDRALLASAVKADDGFFTTHLVSPYSKHVARWAARRGLAPNAVTVASFVIGAAAAACFALGSRVGLVAGAVLLLAAFVADCVDGQLARYTRRFSALGAWLDAIGDRAKEYLAYAGLAVGATVVGVGGVWGLALAAFVLQTTRHMIGFAYTGARPEVVATLPRLALDEESDTPGEHTAQEAAVATGGQAPARPRRSLAGRLGLAAAAVSCRFEARPGLRWLKKIVVLPIGERFLLISVTAAFGGARVTFLALLAWGTLAGLYTLTGRVLRSFA